MGVQRVGGQFYGARVNVDGVRRLPAWAVKLFLKDPRRRSYVVVWTDRDEPGAIVSVSRIEWPEWEQQPGAPEMVQLRDPEGDVGLVILRRPLSIGGEEILLACPECEEPRRHLYPLSIHAGHMTQGEWACRTCSGLRYASEGFYVGRTGRFGFSGPSAEPWDPRAFSSPEIAAEALGTTVEAQPLLQQWGVAPRPSVQGAPLASLPRLERPADPVASDPPPSVPSAASDPVDYNAIAMKARRQASEPAPFDMAPIRRRPRLC